MGVYRTAQISVKRFTVLGLQGGGGVYNLEKSYVTLQRPFKCYVTPWGVGVGGGGWLVGGGGFSFPGKKCYEGLRFNVISVTRGWVGVKFPGKKHYVTFEWPLNGSLEFYS